MRPPRARAPPAARAGWTGGRGRAGAYAWGTSRVGPSSWPSPDQTPFRAWPRIGGRSEDDSTTDRPPPATNAVRARSRYAAIAIAGGMTEPAPSVADTAVQPGPLCLRLLKKKHVKKTVEPTGTDAGNVM